MTKPKSKPDPATLARTVLAGTIGGKKYMDVLYVADNPAEAKAFAAGFNVGKLWEQPVAFVGQSELDAMLGSHDPATLERDIQRALAATRPAKGGA